MSIILSIDTSTTVCSVAIHQDGILLSLTESFGAKSHSKLILSQVEEVLRSALLNISDINAVAVSKGPGSFTGLRIGTSIAKGLCYGLNVPLVSIDTLKAMAYSVNIYNHRKSLLCPMLDARRLEVYSGIFNSNLDLVKPIKAILIDNNFLKEILSEKEVLFFGDGSIKCKPILRERSNAVFYHDIYPSAKFIGVLANISYVNNVFEDLERFEPYYLKDFMEITKN